MSIRGLMGTTPFLFKGIPLLLFHCLNDKNVYEQILMQEIIIILWGYFCPLNYNKVVRVSPYKKMGVSPSIPIILIVMPRTMVTGISNYHEHPTWNSREQYFAPSVMIGSEFGTIALDHIVNCRNWCLPDQDWWQNRFF